MSRGLFGSQTFQIPDFPWDKGREFWQARAEGLRSSGQNVPLEAESAFYTLLPLAPEPWAQAGASPSPAVPSSEQPTVTFFSPPST